ncbi:MAG: hypothetical protein ACTHU0_29065 [Kofleriaceae bacterium]
MRTSVVALVIASGCGSRPPERPAPAAPTCDQAADHAAALLGPEDPSAGRVRDVVRARCTEDRWSAEARSCIVGTRSLAEPRQCKQRLSPEQRAAFERDLAATPPGLAPGDEEWLPPACREWGELVMRSSECQNLSGQAAQRIHQAFSDAVLTWEAAKSSASTWRAIEASCQESAEMLRQLLAPICRW